MSATENHPLAATSKKGKLRNFIEGKLMDAQKSGQVSVVIPRFPDYYGSNVVNRLMAPIFFRIQEYFSESFVQQEICKFVENS
ncbi:hypothetical protein Ngar_c20110 [Candidatus Nitrososphaera gargensis Ga9.2]|uniref:Uncharacterized protein n=1 Tax=Nitrososphaera gargensis (strain Ga9.2) TaxID=1237085 RepID=K0IIP7_NITGG|nr:hypothetical protein Ngar_c20110 [Candidatus Nitrososphaera gargensis Ga9.2]